MAGRPKRNAKLVAQLLEDYQAIRERIDALCPTQYQEEPRHNWNPYRESWASWKEKHGARFDAYYSANELWFLWFDVSQAAFSLWMAMMELSEAMDRRSGLANAGGASARR